MADRADGVRARYYLDASGVELEGRRARTASCSALSSEPPDRGDRAPATTPTSSSGIPIPAPTMRVGGTPRWSTGRLVHQRADDRRHDHGRLHEDRALGVVDEHRHGRSRLAAGHRRGRPRAALRGDGAADGPEQHPSGRIRIAQGLPSKARCGPHDRATGRCSRTPRPTMRRSRRAKRCRSSSVSTRVPR